MLKNQPESSTLDGLKTKIPRPHPLLQKDCKKLFQPKGLVRSFWT